MHRLVIILAALATTGAAGLGWHVYAHDTSCPTTMEYDGLSYSIYEVTGAIVGTGDSNGGVGVGTERGCGDQGPWSDDVAVARIGGVDPRTALVTPVASYILYVAEGVSVDELPSDIAELVAP
jgi:hypothetical protein